MFKLNTESYYYDEADNIGVAINFTNGYCYTMNRMGTAIIRELMNGSTPELVISFFRNIDRCPEQFEKIVSDYIEKLCGYGIVQETQLSAKQEKTTTLSESDASEGFEPEIDEFRDAQDLILADPVHDVDPNMGWPELK